ncbi:hypothetical protein ACGF8B_04535 [Streptomyces sp. NPDC047917]|uniref:hypothetical protein n=1 Tax=Streptomyces sp. NPDC047917 TaxID=3365491 RepID=UPI00371A17EF
MSGKLTKTQESESAESAVKRLKRLSENYHYIQTEAGLIRGALDGLATELTARSADCVMLSTMWPPWATSST